MRKTHSHTHARACTCNHKHTERLSCVDSCTDGREPKVPVVRVTVKAAAAKPKYIITLGGTTEMVREERDVSHGTAVFRDLLILAMPAAVKTASVRLPCSVFVQHS